MAPASARLLDSGGNVLIVNDAVPLKIEWESAVCSRLIRGVGLGSKTDDERLLL
jgi:hypothetical protein